MTAVRSSALVAILLIGCAGGSHGRRSPGAAPSVVREPDGGAGDVQSLIAPMTERVVNARKLAMLRECPGRLASREELIRGVKSHVDHELPPDVLNHESRVLQLLGFVPVNFDYPAAIYALLESELAGYYEPADGTMVLAADLDGDNIDATLAHELTHALQDQHWDLKARSKYRPGESDKTAALLALAEGDATRAMVDVLVQRTKPNSSALLLSDEVLIGQIRASVDSGPTSSTPRILRASLVAPYIEGLRFVNALRRRGGWSEVDRAWTTPLASTSQLLHVEKWLNHEEPIVVRVPEFKALGGHFRSVNVDTEGELGIRIMLEEWMSMARAREVASGWGGDRAVLVADGDEYAFAMKVRYAPGAKVAAAFNEVERGLTRKLGKPSEKRKGYWCIERPDRGPLAIATRGADIAIMGGPASTGEAWKSTGTCAKSRKWSAEILAF